MYPLARRMTSINMGQACIQEMNDFQTSSPQQIFTGQLILNGNCQNAEVLKTEETLHN